MDKTPPTHLGHLLNFLFRPSISDEKVRFADWKALGLHIAVAAGLGVSIAKGFDEVIPGVVPPEVGAMVRWPLLVALTTLQSLALAVLLWLVLAGWLVWPRRRTGARLLIHAVRSVATANVLLPLLVALMLNRVIEQQSFTEPVHAREKVVFAVVACLWIGTHVWLLTVPVSRYLAVSLGRWWARLVTWLSLVVALYLNTSVTGGLLYEAIRAEPVCEAIERKVLERGRIDPEQRTQLLQHCIDSLRSPLNPP